MQFTTFQLLASGLLLFGASTAVAQSNFAASCDNYYVTGTVLYADCLNDNDSAYYATEVDLNYCLANDGGNLICEYGGSYGYSCSDCGLASGTYFECSCQDGSGSSGIDLNNCVGNDDGGLYC